MDDGLFQENACGCGLCRLASGGGGGMADGGSAAAVSTSSLPYYIGSLLPSSIPHWNTTLGQGVTVTYSFMTAAPSYAGSDDRSGFAEMNADQKAAVRQALATYEAVSGLRFSEVGDSGSGGSIRFGTNYQSDSAGYAYYPGTSGSSGDVYIAKNYSYNVTPTPGEYGFLTIVHEIGHAIGLKHPGNYNATGGGTEGPYLPTAQDSTDATVMSYHSGDGADPSAPQPFDIAAVQYLYGPNTAARTGNDTYTFSSGSLIWDGGGTDTLSAAGQTSGVVLDLREGGWSAIGTASSSILATGNLAINYGTLIENAVGGDGNDQITGNASANRLEGGGGNDTLTGGGGNDTFVGGAGDDRVTLGDGGTSTTVSGVETVTGGSGNDVVTLGSDGGRLLVERVETVVGGSGGDWLEIGGQGSTLTLSGVETLVGSGGGDRITLGAPAERLLLAAVETLIGTSGGDFILLGNRGNTMTLTSIETIAGGAGNDAITLTAAGPVLVATIETLTGSAGADLVVLGNRGNTTLVSAVETLAGGLGQDVILAGAAGLTVSVTNIDVLAGGSGTEVVTLGDAGTLTVVALETITGSAGADFVILGNRGSTTAISAVETIGGGANTDIITLGNAGNTILLAGIETLTGGTGTDAIFLGNRGNTMAVSGIESITGAANTDAVTVTSGALVFRGNAGADAVTLVAGTNTDTIVFADSTDGGAAGAAGGYDTVANFQAGTDRLALTGALRTQVDEDGTLAVRTRAGGAVDMGADDVVVLSTAAASLANTDLAAFRTALGTVSNSSAGADVLVLANDGANTGVYVVVDADGNGTIGAAEVRLLGTFSGALLTTSDVVAV